MTQNIDSAISEAQRGLVIAEGLALSELDGIEHTIHVLLQQEIKHHFNSIAENVEQQLGVYNGFSVLELANRGKSICKGIGDQYEQGEVVQDLLSTLYHEMENLFKQIGEKLVSLKAHQQAQEAPEGQPEPV
ncbi:hypothetical protein [Pontibacterium sp.]|uniref:hypothetical protein n=1 Tax=Pontibacterium sp. TaxID=2036026 RepID=UPI003511EDD4